MYSPQFLRKYEKSMKLLSLTVAILLIVGHFGLVRDVVVADSHVDISGKVMFKDSPAPENTIVIARLKEESTECGRFATTENGAYQFILSSECNSGTLVFILFGLAETKANNEDPVPTDDQIIDVQFSTFSFDTTGEMSSVGIGQIVLFLQAAEISGEKRSIDTSGLYKIFIWILIIVGILLLIIVARNALPNHPWLAAVVTVLTAPMKRIVGDFQWLPLVSLSGLVGVIIAGLILDWFPDIRIPKDFLGFDGTLVVVSGVAGFLGSFVRLLNRAVDETSDMPLATMVFNGLLRPLAGAMLGLFVMAVFASGMIAMPIGDPKDDLFGGINKGSAFVFGAAFVAGLVDEYVTNLANKFILLARPVPVPVPDVVGSSQVDAQAAIVSAGLTVGNVTTENSDTVPGHVISQSPVARTQVAPRSSVRLVVSSGPAVGGPVDLVVSSGFV